MNLLFSAMPLPLKYLLLLQLVLVLSPFVLKGQHDSSPYFHIHRSDFDTVNLGRFAHYYYDSTAELSAAAVQGIPFQSGEDFTFADHKFWITRGNVWAKVGLVNHTADTLTCFTRLDWHSFIDLYQLGYPPLLLEKRGKMKPLQVTSAYEYGHFSIRVPPRDSLVLLFRMNNRLAKRTRNYSRILLFSEVEYFRFMKALESKGYLKDQLNFFLIAFLFSVSLFTLFQYLQIRDKTYLAYFCYVFLGMLYLFRDSGIVKTITPFFHAIPELVAYSGPFFTIATLLSYQVFLQLFLELKSTWPRLNRILNVLAIVLIAFLVLDVLFMTLTREIKIHLYFFTVLRLLFNTISVGIVLAIALYGTGRLRYYVILGVGGLMLGSIVNLGVGAFFIYNSPKYMDHVQIIPDLALASGLMFELVCFSLGLGYKTHLNTLEKAQAKEDLRIQEKETAHLQQLQSVRNRFYTNITHEFRTPLTIILGVAKQLMKKAENSLKAPAAFQEHLAMIQRNGQQLLQLVNQMLDLAKLESGNIRLNYVQGDLIIFLKYLTESFHSLAENNAIEMHFLSDLDEMVMDYDPERLQQVFYNLLSNSLKFTPEGGHIYVQVEPVPNKDTPFLKIKVKDTGIGIPEDQRVKIFDRFYQSDSHHVLPTEGSGIGLALVKELVELMQGSIEVKSKVGKGTEFIVTLPVTLKAPLKQAGSPVALTEGLPPIPTGKLDLPVTPSGKHRILVIEDHQDVLQYISHCLGDHFQVDVARNGEEGLQKARKTIPDLVICDVMMPILDGFAVCETLKTDRRTSHIPILMLTAKVDQESRLEGLKKGADRYLVKPFQEEELLLHLNNLLLQRDRLQEHYRRVSGHRSPTVDSQLVTAPDELFMQKVHTVIQENLSNGSFTVSQMALELALSQSQLHRKLMALTGYSASKMIRLARLEKAQELLQNHSLTVAAVAYDSGFNDPDYLSKVFKQAFGITPSEFRASQVNP